VPIRKDGLDRLVDFLWGLVLVCLPVTSFPFMPLIGKETQVRPLSVYPMLLLVPLILIQMQRKRIKVWHTVFTPLTVFLLIALGATFIGSFYAPLDLRGMDYWGRALRAMVTVLIGMGFFLFGIWAMRSRDQLLDSLKWLYLGLFISFLWSIFQLLVYYGWVLNQNILDSLQRLFSISGISLKNLRIPGFTLEPSWMAGQIASIYLPWLFASILTGFKLTRWRWLEYALAGMALFLLVLTYSRSGLLMALVAGLLTTLFVGREKIKQAWSWWKQPFQAGLATKKNQKRDIAFRLGLVTLLLSLVWVSLQAFSHNTYFSKIWSSRKTNLIEYVIDIYAGPRLAYALSGLEAFNQHPWTGVGLGATGFYMFSNLPDWSKTFVTEVASLLSPLNMTYANTKNLFIRILAETGILGMGAFIIFFLHILARILGFRSFPGKEARFMEVAGLFSWIAILLFSFTQDSFAMPNTWINLALLLGVVGQDWKSIRDHPA
jgi:O-antigen ligase